MIQGELIHFVDPTLCLPPIDRLEGFQPGMPSLYQRVLVPVSVGNETVPAWCYVTGEQINLHTLSFDKIRWPG